MTGGLLGGVLNLLPVERCIPNAVDKGLNLLEVGRRHSGPCKSALTDVLLTVEKEWGLTLLPGEFLLSFRTQANAKGPFLGLRCQAPEGEGAVVWVEYRETGTGRSSLLQAGSYSSMMRSFRHPLAFLEPVSPPRSQHVVSFSRHLAR